MSLPAAGETAKLGKGSLLLESIIGGVGIGGFEFMDNATAVEISGDVTQAELYSSTQSSAPLIAAATTRIGYTINATLTGFTLGNMKRWLFGQSKSRAQTLAANHTETFSGAAVFKGGYLRVPDRRITNVSVMRDGSDAMVLDTDYTVYADQGIIGITKLGAIQDGDIVAIEYDRPALTVDQISIGEEASPVCHLLYLADDANTDGVAAKDTLELWKVQFAPNGALPLVSDDYATYQVTMKVLSDATNHPGDPFGLLERIRAAA